jgi:glycosyltransferase involved in cell wall biosynthesis
MPMPPRVSVVLCTHNPRDDYLRRTIASLQQQSLARDAWELVLVDNASRRPLASSWDLSWHPAARHVREDQLGLTHARLRGIAESEGNMIVFVDDDNVLDAGYLAAAIELRCSHPHLGVFGAGRLEPEFEVPPPATLRSRLPLLALRTIGQDRWSNNPGDASSLPWGAGLCVTRSVAGSYAQLLRRLDVSTHLGRRGGQLLSGEDDLFSWAAAIGGCGFGIFPALALTHLIAASRLTGDYFVRLVEGHAFSHGVLDHLLSDRRPRPEPLPLSAARLAVHGLRHGLVSMRCRWAERAGQLRALAFIEARRLRALSLAPVADDARSVQGNPAVVVAERQTA